MRPLWSQTVGPSLRGLERAAQSRGWFLVWDSRHNLFLFNHRGERQAEASALGPLAAAAAADDGRTFAVAGQNGQVYLLAPDLTQRWQRSIDRGATAVAIDPFGQRVAVAGADGGVHLFDESGNHLWTSSIPRPLHFLSFIPERRALVGSADFGLVVCFDAAGKCLWRDGLVAHVGSLTVTGDGGTIALACFSDGACCYTLADGPKARRMVAGAAPCRLLACSYSGDVWATLGLEPRLTLRKSDGSPQSEAVLEGRPVGLALNPLGTEAVVATAEGALLLFEQP